MGEYFRRYWSPSATRTAAPGWKSVPDFLKRAEQVYTAEQGAARQLIALACAHHRLAWLHRFREPNRRSTMCSWHSGQGTSRN